MANNFSVKGDFMSFKKHFLRFFSNQKPGKKNTLQTRSSHLEALEDRQLLDAIGFTSVEQTTFQATFSDQESNESRYLILEVRAAEGTQLTEDFSVSIREASAEEGEVNFISSKIENNVASFLAEYVLSNDKTYVFEVGPELEDATYDVRFIMAGDENADNVLSNTEYYQLKGQAYEAQGTSAAFIQRYKLTYGVEIPNEVNTLYDLNGNGKLEMATFREVFEPNFTDTIVLKQEITTIPVIKSLKIGGETPNQFEDEDFTFVSNKTSSISGKTAAKSCDFSYETADGTFALEDFDLTQESAEIVLTSGEGSEAKTMKLSYTLKDGEFTITPKDGALPEGTLTLELDNKFQTNTYTLVIDLTAPEIQASKAYIGDSPNEKDEYYTNKTEFELNVKYTLETGNESDTLEDVLEKEPYGLYIHVFENDAEVKVKRLTESTESFVTLTDVTEGKHTYSVQITDLAGNLYGTGTISVVVNASFTAPSLKVEGYEITEGKEYMLVTDETITLTPVTDEGATVEYDGDLEYTESEGAYTFTLEEGLNVITFIATDKAGNTTSTTCNVYYEAELKLTQGENVTENVTALSGSLNLYDYFNYKSGLTFNVTCALQNLESFTEDSENPGTYNYKFKESTTETALTESIVVVAKTASGEQSVTLHINLCYVSTPWIDVTVKDELEDSDLHIVKTDGITLNGTLANSETSGIVNIYFANEEEPIIENVDLAELYAEEGHTKVYGNWRLTYTKTTVEGVTTFILTLNEVDESGKTIALEDGKYTIHVGQNQSETLVKYIIYRYAQPATTCLEVSITSENDPSPILGIVQIGDATELDLAEGVTINVYSDSQTLYATTTVTFDEDGRMKKDYTWDYKVKSLEEGVYTFTYEFINASKQMNLVEETKTYIVDKTAPVISITQDGNLLENGGSSVIATDRVSLKVAIEDATQTSMICMMYNSQDENDEGIEFNPENFTLAYIDTRVEITVTDAAENSSSWTYNYSCRPQVSDLVVDGKYYVVQTIGAEEKVINLRDLFSFKSSEKPLVISVEGPEGAWELEDDKLTINWATLTDTLTLTACASINNEEITKVTISIIASKTEDDDYPRWINLTTDGNYLEEEDLFFMNLTTGKTISGELYDSSGVASASLAIYQWTSETEKSLVTTVADLHKQVKDGKYSLDLTQLTDSQGKALTLEDGMYEIHFYGKDANASPKESTEENGHYQTIYFVVNQSLSVTHNVTITPTNKTTMDPACVNALELTLSSSGTISELDKEGGLLVTVTGTDGTQTLTLWTGFYQNGQWVSESGLRTDTTFTLDVKALGMEDGLWTFTVKTTNIALTTSTSTASTTLDTEPPVITSSLYALDYDSEAKEETTGVKADSMSWAAPEWEMEAAVNMELNEPATDVTRTYYANQAEVALEDGKFPLDYGKNSLEVRDSDAAGNQGSATYYVVYNSLPKLTKAGEAAKDSGLYLAYSNSGTEIDLTTLFEDEDEAETAPTYSAEISKAGDLSITSCTEAGILTLTTREEPSVATPTLSGSISVTVIDEYGASLTQDFTVNIISKYTENSAENLLLDGAYPVTKASGAKLTTQLIHQRDSEEILTITDENGNSVQLNLTKESGTFTFNAEKCSYSAVKVTDVQYDLTINFVEGSLEYGTYSLLLDGETIGEFTRRDSGEEPGVPVLSQDSMVLDLGETSFEIVRNDYNTWSLVFDDGQEIEVTGENVDASTELKILDLIIGTDDKYTIDPSVNKLELIFVNEDGKTSASWATINLEFAATVIDESLDVSGEDEIVKAKILGTYYEEGSTLTYEFTDQEFSSLGTCTIPEEHAISKFELNDANHLVVTYSPYNVEQDRSPIEVNATTKNGDSITFNVCMEYEKPFTLVASVTKPYESGSKNMVSVDTETDYSRRVYDPSDEEDADLLLNKNFNFEVWLKVDLPIVSKELYDKYDISYTNNVLSLISTTQVEGGDVNSVNSRSLLYKEITTDEKTGVESVLAKVVASSLTTGLCACGTDGNYSCVLELEVEPDETGVSPTFKITFDGTGSDMEHFQYKTSEDSPYSVVNPAQINNGIAGQTFELKLKETPVSVQAALLENVDSLDAAVQVSTPIPATAESALEGLEVESWIQDGSESLGCSTILASGIVDKDALVTSLASSTAIQQTANALVDSIFDEEEK